MIELIKKKLNNINASFYEIHLEKKLITSINLSNGEIEGVGKKEVINGNVRVLNENQWGFVSFNNIDDIDKYIQLAVLNSQEAAKYSKIKRGISSYNKVIDSFYSSFIINPFEVDLSEKYRLLKKYDSILKPFKNIINRKIIYVEKKEEVYYGNSEGSLISTDNIFTGASVTGVAREGSNIQTGYDSWGGYEGYEIVKDHEDEVENIGKIAEDLLKAEMIEGGKYDVVMDPKLTGVFAHEAFGHLSEADFIFENPAMRNVMELGKKFGIDDLNIIDDGSIQKEAGFIFTDSEGVKPEKTYLVKNGILNSRLHSRETAFKMNEQLTGNARAISASHEPIVRMTNTYLDKGKYPLKDILDSVDDGIYAVDCIGGQTNLEMFTFSAGWAYKIKNGKIQEMLKNVVLSGNVFETLKSIDMIGDDMKLHGGIGGCGKGGQSPLPVSTGGPHIKISNVLIGGV